MTRARAWHGRLEAEGPPAAPAGAGEWLRTEFHGGTPDGRAEEGGSSLPARRVRASTRRTDVRACPGAHSMPDPVYVPVVGNEGKTAARAGAEEGRAAVAVGGMEPEVVAPFHREARGRVVA